MYFIKTFSLKVVNIFTDKSQKSTAARISYQRTQKPLPKKCELSVKIQQSKKRTRITIDLKTQTFKIDLPRDMDLASIFFKVDT